MSSKSEKSGVKPQETKETKKTPEEQAEVDAVAARLKEAKKSFDDASYNHDVVSKSIGDILNQLDLGEKKAEGAKILLEGMDDKIKNSSYVFLDYGRYRVETSGPAYKNADGKYEYKDVRYDSLVDLLDRGMKAFEGNEGAKKAAENGKNRFENASEFATEFNEYASSLWFIVNQLDLSDDKEKELATGVWNHLKNIRDQYNSEEPNNGVIAQNVDAIKAMLTGLKANLEGGSKYAFLTGKMNETLIAGSKLPDLAKEHLGKADKDKEPTAEAAEVAPETRDAKPEFKTTEEVTEHYTKMFKPEENADPAIKGLCTDYQKKFDDLKAKNLPLEEYAEKAYVLGAAFELAKEEFVVTDAKKATDKFVELRERYKKTLDDLMKEFGNKPPKEIQEAIDALKAQFDEEKKKQAETPKNWMEDIQSTGKHMMEKFFNWIKEIFELFGMYMNTGWAAETISNARETDEYKNTKGFEKRDFNRSKLIHETQEDAGKQDSTVAYISSVLGLGAVSKDFTPTQLFAGLEKSGAYTEPLKAKPADGKYEEESKIRGTYDSVVAVGAVLFFGDPEKGKEITHTAIVVHQSKLGEAKIRYVNESGAVVQTQIGANSKFLFPNLVSALHSTEDLRTEEDAQKELEAVPEPKEKLEQRPTEEKEIEHGKEIDDMIDHHPIGEALVMDKIEFADNQMIQTLVDDKYKIIESQKPAFKDKTNQEIYDALTAIHGEYKEQKEELLK
ncbi:MAG: hypothetical protein ABH856_02075 [Patescibacteria group bacterium]|nr:hypothetical protein [Patescibacteria group bacterium]